MIMTIGQVGLQFVYMIICNKNKMSMSSFFCLYRICSRQFLEFLLCIQRRSSKYIFQISTGAS